MAALAFAALLLLTMAGQSRANWCVCKEGLGDAVLQKTLDYACGAGADCNPIHSGGGCFNPNTVKAHCNYAVNSYFQKKGQSQGSCDFSGTATPVVSDPSITGCVYPSSASTSGTTTPVSGTPSTSTGTPSTSTGTPSTSTGTPSTSTGTGTTTPTTSTTPSTSNTTPTSTTPYTPGVLGGINTGVGPSGVGINTDDSDGIRVINNASLFSSFITLFFSGLMLWWG